VGNLLGEKFHRKVWNIFVETTWDIFMDVVKEKYYPVGNYDD
jgi:hypothetical protein